MVCICYTELYEFEHSNGYFTKQLPENNFSNQLSINLSNARKVGLNVINRYDDFITQLPFELKLTMPPTDRGGRGYSDKLVAEIKNELNNTKPLNHIDKGLV